MQAGVSSGSGGDEAQRTDVRSGRLVKELPSVDDFARWMEQNGGQLPQKQTSEQLTDQKCQEEHRMFHFLQLQKRRMEKGALTRKQRIN